MQRQTCTLCGYLNRSLKASALGANLNIVKQIVFLHSNHLACVMCHFNPPFCLLRQYCRLL